MPILNHKRAFFPEHKAGYVCVLQITVPQSYLLHADSIVEIILHLHVLQRVVADQKRSQLLLVEVHKPVDKGACGPASRLSAQEIGRPSADRLGNERLFLVWMHYLLIHGSRHLRCIPFVVVCTGLGRHEDLLHCVHERAEDQRGQHHKHQSRRDHELVVLVRVAIRARLAALAATTIEETTNEVTMVGDKPIKKMPKVEKKEIPKVTKDKLITFLRLQRMEF